MRSEAVWLTADEWNEWQEGDAALWEGVKSQFPELDSGSDEGTRVLTDAYGLAVGAKDFWGPRGEFLTADPFGLARDQLHQRASLVHRLQRTELAREANLAKAKKARRKSADEWQATARKILETYEREQGRAFKLGERMVRGSLKLAEARLAEDHDGNGPSAARIGNFWREVIAGRQLATNSSPAATVSNSVRNET